jgi:hypothetical protein
VAAACGLNRPLRLRRGLQAYLCPRSWCPSRRPVIRNVSRSDVHPASVKSRSPWGVSRSDGLHSFISFWHINGCFQHTKQNYCFYAEAPIYVSGSLVAAFQHANGRAMHVSRPRSGYSRLSSAGILGYSDPSSQLSIWRRPSPGTPFFGPSRAGRRSSRRPWPFLFAQAQASRAGWGGCWGIRGRKPLWMLHFARSPYPARRGCRILGESKEPWLG